MGTPLKSLQALLSPRALSPLSPLSPKLLSAPKKFDNFLKVSSGEAKRICHVAKRLEFSQYSSSKQFEEPIQIKISDYTDVNRELIATKDVVINTPNKKNIFENGIDGNHNHTLLGVGSFGRVIRGIHKGDIVAVKVVKNASILGERNVLDLNHENIVRTLDIIEDPESNFSLIIMEYFPNSRQLQTLLEYDNYEIEARMISFAMDICNGLDFVHGKGVLHLDIKPQNILVAGNVCKICDFGNSVLVTETEKFNHQGTVVYTAPELLQGKTPTEKCDVYSLGIVLWQLKSRISPYCGIDNVETVIYKVGETRVS
ncbi:serine/threonine-protein kinase mos [Anoplophora glabripennis]|uniref:serine/threonine-protein kinase mos n=1 Tax=Anoplophora glabripennis TaxID=217634 RepID=UPI0008740334|nr:serine/threonine-protein kinase mos [Anoplophora glabripennis]